MMRSVLAAFALICLAAAPAAAQISNNYWLAAPSANVSTPPKPPPAPEIPDVPFAPAHNIQLLAKATTEKDFKPGPWAPLWLGSDEVALLGTRKGQVVLVSRYVGHFDSSRVVADSSALGGGTILDMAVSRDGKHLAVAVDSGGKLQIWTRDTQGTAPASVIAAIDGTCEKAGLAWLEPDKLAVGAQLQPNPVPTPQAEMPVVMPGQEPQAQSPPEPRRIVNFIQTGSQGPPAGLDLECLSHIQPWTLIWSPEGHYAVAQTDEPGKWNLIDRDRKTCSAIAMPGIVPVAFIDWGDKSQRFLFTATPQRAPDPGHIGVMEYTLASHKVRLLASPATAAAYIGSGRIAVLGSQRLSAAAMVANPNALLPAEMAWINPEQSELDIVPTGFASSAAELLHAAVSYSAANGLLATSFLTPNPKGPFTVLLWISAASRSGGVLGTGRRGSMVTSWSPDGSKLAVLAGLPDHPTLAIIAAPISSPAR